MRMVKILNIGMRAVCSDGSSSGDGQKGRWAEAVRSREKWNEAIDRPQRPTWQTLPLWAQWQVRSTAERQKSRNLLLCFLEISLNPD